MHTEKQLVIGEDPKGHRVTLELEIEHRGPEQTTTGKVITHRTVNLEPVTEYDRLSISGSSRNGLGQIGDTIREELDDYRRLYIPKDSILRILEIWDTYHCNDLNAGTAEQDKALAAHYREFPTQKRDYTNDCRVLEECALLADRGYKYGSEWLVGALPEDVKAEITALFDAAEQPTEPEADSMSAFVARHRIRFDCKRVATRSDGLMTAPDMRHFRCRIATGRRSFGVYFSQGSAHTEDPTAEQVLNCIADDASSYEQARSFEEWAREMGDDPDSRKAEKVYRAVKRQAEQLKRTLGEEAFTELLYDIARL